MSKHKKLRKIYGENTVCLMEFLAVFLFFFQRENRIIFLILSLSGVTEKAKDKQGWEMAQLSVMKQMLSVDTFILQLLPLGPSLFSELAFADD